MSSWGGFRVALRDDPAGVEDVLSVADMLGLPREELAQAVEIESAWNPAARNPTTRATGLIQFMPSTARRLGTTVDDLRSMSRSKQAGYVAGYLRLGGMNFSYRQPGDVYLMVAGPAGLGHADGDVLYPVGSPGWRDNPGWRTPGGGPVTVGKVRSLGIPPPGGLPGPAGPGAKPPAKPPAKGGAGAFLLLALAWFASKR